MSEKQERKEIGVLKSLWRKDQAGHWGIHDLKSLTLKPRSGFDSDFFPFESQLELMSTTPAARNMLELIASFGPTDFLMKQSIVPVVAFVERERSIRSIGT